MGNGVLPPKVSASERNVHRYRFGPFCIEVDTGILRCNGQPVPMAPKAFDILQLLVSKAGDVLSKDAIRTAVWPDTYVELKNVGVQIVSVRKALGDAAEDPKYVETVGRRGYRFIAVVSEEICERSKSETSLDEPASKREMPRRSRLGPRSMVMAVLSAACVLVVAGLRTISDSSIDDSRVPVNDTEQRSADVGARAFYETGAYYSSQPGSDSVRNAVAYLTAATERDPSFAAAYSLLAQERVIFADAVGRNDQELKAAEQAATRALALNPKLTQALLALAVVQSELHWDWVRAESTYRHALELDPSNALAHEWFGSFLALTGRVDEGLSHARRAVTLAQGKVSTLRNLGEILLYNGNCEQAATTLRNALEIRPGNEWVRDLLTRAYLCLDEQDSGAAADYFGRILPGFRPPSLRDLSDAYSQDRWRAVQRARLDDLLAETKVRTIDPLVIAAAYASVGNRSQALDAIEKSFAEHSSLLRYVAFEPAFKGLRDQPRYQSILARMGLPSPASRR
jgi:DNA-binding winged helix-turn-helix (wHTH) protein/Flp pilus assembly protein TadD